MAINCLLYVCSTMVGQIWVEQALSLQQLGIMMKHHLMNMVNLVFFSYNQNESLSF